MKVNPMPDPERWSERGAGHGATPSAEDVIGASFRQIRATTEPTDAAAQRWARRAMAASPRPIVGRGWSFAIAGLILTAGSAVAAGVWRAAATKKSAPPPATEPLPAAPAPRHLAARPHAPPPEVLPDPEVAAESPPLPPSVKTVHAPAVRPTTEPPALAPEAPDEARLVARAFRHLRSEGDATAALAALDERERQFGAGALATEAALARAEALLLLGRTDEALPILVGLRDPGTGLTRDVRVARGELLAKANRCAEALADFDAALTGGGRATRERALYGRASCRLQLGRADAARADLGDYLKEYPQGRFASTVREALERLRRP